MATLLAILVTMAAIPALASAQQVSPTERQYGNVLTQTGAGVDQPSPTPQPTSDSGRVVDSLPFTGLDVGLLLAVAVLVGGSGLVLRRAARTEADKR